MVYFGDMEISTLIRRARAARGMTQRELAQALNVSPSAVAQWETNQTNPSIENRVDLAKEFGIPFVDLLPEAERLTELSIRDPETIVFVRRFLQLPAPVREGLLMQVAAMAESLASRSADSIPALPAPKPGN